MRKFLRLWFILLFLGFGLRAFTNPIDSLQALNFAQKFYALQNPQAKSGRSIAFNFSIEQKVAYQGISNNSSKSRLTAQDEYLYYIFNVGESNGFVIVAGDDASLPILGYSITGHYDSKNLPINLLKWMDGYKDQLQYIKDDKLSATSEIKTEWQNFGNTKSKSSRIASVSPLIQTTWNQNPYYNKFCPYDNSGQSVTGCTATAMAQIMKYWNYPSKGKGFGSYTVNGGTGATIPIDATYDWTNMPASLGTSSTTTQNNAVATLMYNCGASVGMQYSSTSSGATPTPEAYISNFSYANTVQTVSRQSYSDSDWIQILNIELNAGRPIQYQGFNNTGSGHSFVCDGYNSIVEKFHFNWGWGGYVDGYFVINSLNPGGGGTGSGAGTYNQNQYILIGIQPPATNINYDIRLYTAISASVSAGTTTVSLNVQNMAINSYNFQGDITVALFDKDYKFYGFVDTKSGLSLPTNNIFSNPLVFTNDQLLYSPGNYYLAVYYKATGGGWVQAGAGSYQNPKQISLYDPVSKPINMYSNITYNASSTPNPREQEWFSGQYNVSNTSSTTFNGDVGIRAYDIQGNSKGILSSQTVSLPAYSHYTNNLSFYTSALNLEAGSYYLQAVYKNASTTTWNSVGSNGTYYNLIRFDVAEAILTPDIYESNDSEPTAYTLPYYSNPYQVIQTTSSNLHNGLDQDFYKIQLPQDSSRYFIKARVHDSYNSGLGRFRADVIFNYKNGSSAWSPPYDTYLPFQNIVSRGGDVKFQVAPYYSGYKGTYLLDVSVTKYNQPNLYLNASSTYVNASSTCVGGNTWAYASAGFDYYDWYKNSTYVGTSSSNYFNASTTGTYSVKAYKWGEVLNGANVFTVYDNPVAPTLTASIGGTITTEINICNGTAVSLNANGCGINTVKWFVGTTEQLSTSNPLNIIPPNTITYTAKCQIASCSSANSPPVRIVNEPNIQSTKSGNWQDPTMWTNNFVPLNCQTVTIQTGHTVTVPINDAKAKNIIIRGNLNFLNVSPTVKGKVGLGI
jgi:hypothetical protein